MWWNIQEPASSIKVYDRPIRSGDDFKELRVYRGISGQAMADQRGLSPSYAENQLSGISPQCVMEAATVVTALP